MTEPRIITRRFLPQDFKITTWEALKPYMDDLADREFNSKDDFQRFLEDENEIDAILSDDAAWRYISKSRDTNNKEIENHFTYFITEISPKLSIYGNKINKKVAASPYAKEFDWEGFSIVLGKIENSNKIFREANIPLGTEIGLKSNEVNSLRGNMDVELDGEKLTIMQAEDRLYLNDRDKRQQAWQVVLNRLFQDKDKLDTLFDEMFTLRQQQAKNADFLNYRDFSFAARNRIDYTPEDCYKFHEAVKKSVVPLVKQMQRERKQHLGVETLYPWDLNVDPFGREPLKAFDGEEDFMNKTQQMFDAVDPYFGDCFRLLREKKQLDLMSRPGKEPGGYNYPLQEKSIPFIFQNSTHKMEDIVTIAHEGGHAIHAISSADLRLVSFRHYPSEIAELASMSMELFTMGHWDVFFADKEQLYRAQREHLEQIITMLAWISVVDEFQHKLYFQKQPSIEKRHELWVEVIKEYNTGEIEKDDHIYGHAGRTSWLKQNHIFELPFYYIDYGIAQLGALEIWRNFKRDPKKAVAQYKEALRLGHTKPMPDIYKIAGASFDFSSDNIKELMQFVSDEIAEISRKEKAEHNKK